jgi:hypothetical protein
MQFSVDLVVSEPHQPEYTEESSTHDNLDDAIAKARKLDSGELYNAFVRIEVLGWRVK